MPSTYPTTADSLPLPTWTGTLGQPARPASAFLTDVVDAVKAVQAALGTSAAAGTLPALRGYTRIDVVAAHGADRTGVASASAAVDAAIAAANTAGGKVEIYFPPGSYNLTAGVTTAITTSHVHVVGGGMGVTTLLGGSNTLFAWGNGGAATVVGGGMRDLSLTYTSPATSSRAVHINGASSQKFARLFLDNVRTLARLGESGALAAAPSFEHVYGATDPAANSVVLDAAFGSALRLSDVVVNAKGVGFPADTTTPHPAAAGTTFLRLGQGGWDTVHAHGVITNRYDRGLDIDASAAVVLTNMWFTNCVFDYSKSHGIRIRANNAGSNIRSLYFTACWAVGTDGHSVEVLGTAGLLKHIHFTDCVGRQAGQNNWRVSGSGLEDVSLTACHGLGANRLAASNAGSLQDDTVILASNVTIRGGRFGEDGSSYTGFTCQGRYGITLGGDVLAYLVRDAEVSGVTDAFQLGANTSGSKRRLVTGNKTPTGAPSYATTAAFTAPTSNVEQTHMAATVDRLMVFGGTVTSIQVNGVEVGTTGPATVTLSPGDTWKLIYSAAPTVVRQVVA